MQVIRKAILGTFLMILPLSTLSAVNHTTDVNGWGYTEIREFTIKPYAIPIGAAILLISIAYLVEECQVRNSH